jgi:hypothetical protein
LQLASTLGFVLNKRDGKHMHLTPTEEAAVHECLTWARQGQNNKVLTLFGTIFEQFHAACGLLMNKFKSVMPEGSMRARIRATKRETLENYDTELGATLCQESCGMIVVDHSGFPLKYDTLSIYSEVVATQATRIELDVPGEGGRGWRRSGSFVDTALQPDLGAAWCHDIQNGCQHLLTETWVPANDPHYDAKCWPCAHPYGSGSLLSEPGSGGTQRHARSRLTALQRFFRRSSLWGFWFLDRLIKTELFFKERRRRQAGRPSTGPGETDPIKKLFGTAQPGPQAQTCSQPCRHQRTCFRTSASKSVSPAREAGNSSRIDGVVATPAEGLACHVGR